MCLCVCLSYHQVLCHWFNDFDSLESFGCLSLIPLPFHFNFFTYIPMWNFSELARELSLFCFTCLTRVVFSPHFWTNNNLFCLSFAFISYFFLCILHEIIMSSFIKWKCDKDSHRKSLAGREEIKMSSLIFFNVAFILFCGPKQKKTKVHITWNRKEKFQSIPWQIFTFNWTFQSFVLGTVESVLQISRRENKTSKWQAITYLFLEEKTLLASFTRAHRQTKTFYRSSLMPIHGRVHFVFETR